MTEENKKILESINEALPKMSEFDKGYFLGMAEATVAAKKENTGELNMNAGAAG